MSSKQFTKLILGTGTLGYPVERDTHCQMSQPIMVPWYNLDVAGALSHQWYSASTWHQVNTFAITGIHRLLEEGLRRLTHLNSL